MTQAPVPRPLASLACYQARADRITPAKRIVPEETPVAFVYNGATHAVMMATPADLEDFASGFSLSEGIVNVVDDIVDLEIVAGEFGIELRMWLAQPYSTQFMTRRRASAGPVGCGLCGVESLAEAMRAPPKVSGSQRVSPLAISSAMRALTAHQLMNQQANAMHAAAFWRPHMGLIAVREDVGRHNALDKLAGALARINARTCDGAVLLTSRVSVEMVQKAARLGAPMIVAISGPTALAVRTADACGITLVAIARDDDFAVFSHRGRVGGCEQANAHTAT
jgi:FdhD protein